MTTVDDVSRPSRFAGPDEAISIEEFGWPPATTAVPSGAGRRGGADGVRRGRAVGTRGRRRTGRRG
ncbi:hypothetical protein OG559_04325 [Micromonospora sp. NBC_01405]|uniref:hypothetical protein n=1 Tax=Micromonospora sp. NBC_01405 TaxID=2903589 RepID=UPI003252770E